MKKLLSLFVTLLSMLTAHAIGIVDVPKPMPVSQNDALAITKRQFGGNADSYNYYLIQDSDSIKWSIFVDAVPGANWEHECYVAKVSRSTHGYIPNLLPDELIQRSYPPAETLELIYAPLSHVLERKQKPTVAWGCIIGFRARICEQNVCHYSQWRNQQKCKPRTLLERLLIYISDARQKTWRSKSQYQCCNGGRHRPGRGYAAPW